MLVLIFFELIALLSLVHFLHFKTMVSHLLHMVISQFKNALKFFFITKSMEYDCHIFLK